MKTNYLALHTAINLFEDYRVEAIKRIIDSYQTLDGTFPKRFPKEIAIFLYYLNDTIYINNEKLEGIGLYGKYYKDEASIDFGNKIGSHVLMQDPLVKIPTEIILLDYTYSLERKIKSEYIIENSYRYNERYLEDHNYAVLTNASTGEIQYTQLSVKYEEFSELMKKISEHVENLIKKMGKR